MEDSQPTCELVTSKHNAVESKKVLSVETCHFVGVEAGPAGQSDFIPTNPRSKVVSYFGVRAGSGLNLKRYWGGGSRKGRGE